MSKKHLENPVTLILELDDLMWLNNFLKDERIAAEIDHEEVASLHTDAAIRAAKEALGHECNRMTKVINVLDDALVADDVREAISKRIAAVTFGMQSIVNTND